MLYFDNASTSIPYNEALEEYNKVSKTYFANPSSDHGLGRQANRLLDSYRNQILSFLNLDKSHECVFTSGATEANNLAIKGIAFAYANRGKRIISSPTEHPSVINSFNQLRDNFGFEVIYLKVDEYGQPSYEDLLDRLNRDTILVSLMGVNNETGTILDIDKLSSLVRQYPKCFLHVDATQSIGKINMDYSKVDLISFSAHKFGGPKGVGALIYKKGISFLPLHSGGHQQDGVRAGTIDLPSIAGMIKALEISYAHLEENLEKEKQLATYLREGLSKIEGVRINSSLIASPYVVNFSLTHHKASIITEALSEKEIYVSSVSACSSKKEETSYVLLSCGLDKQLASNSIRVSMPPTTSIEEIDYFLDTLKTLLKEIKPL